MTHPCARQDSNICVHDVSMCKTGLILLCYITHPSTLTPLDSTHLFVGEIDDKCRNVSDTACDMAVGGWGRVPFSRI